jgi:O-antigen/teichoic acid export membrane protein
MKSKSFILGRNILSNFTAQAVVIIVTFFTTPLIIRGLGETNYGLLIFLTTIVNFFLSFDFGLAPAYTQSFSEQFGKNKKQTETFFSGLFLYLIVITAWSLLLYLLTPFIVDRFVIQSELQETAKVGLRMFSLILLVGGLSGFASYTFQALQKFYLANLKPILGGFLIPIGTILLIQHQYGLIQIFYLHLVVQAFILSLFVFILVRNISLYKKAVSSEIVKKIITFAKWKFLGQLAGQLRQKAGRFIITGFFNLQMLTLYAVPQNLAERFLSLQPNITSPIFTMAALLKGKHKQKKLNYFYKHAVKLVNFSLLPLGIFVFFYADSFLSLWIGLEFAVKTTPVLKVLMLGVCLNLLNGAPTVFLEGLGRPAFPSMFSVVLAVVYIMLSVWLIPAYGIIGAAMALTLTYFFLTPFYIYKASKKILKVVSPFLMLRLYVVPSALAFLSGFIVWILIGNPSNWLVFLSSLALYLLCFYVLSLTTRQLGQEEKKIFSNVVKGFLSK